MTKVKNIQKGFTLIELLLVAVIGVSLMAAVLSLLFTFYHSRQTNSKNSDLITANELILNKISQDIHWNRGINYTSNTLSIQRQNGSVSVYKVVDGTLMLDDTPITSDKIIVEEFHLTNKSSNSDYPLIKIQLSLKHASPTKPDTYYTTDVAISKRKSQEGK